MVVLPADPLEAFVAGGQERQLFEDLAEAWAITTDELKRAWRRLGGPRAPRTFPRIARQKGSPDPSKNAIPAIGTLDSTLTSTLRRSPSIMPS